MAQALFYKRIRKFSETGAKPGGRNCGLPVVVVQQKEKTCRRAINIESQRYKGVNKIRYINLCIVEFGKRMGMPSTQAFNYLNAYKGFSFLDRNYEAEHLLPLEDTLADLADYCKRHGGTMA